MPLLRSACRQTNRSA